jgi:uncharacterized protein YybS (DUF2232 family)
LFPVIGQVALFVIPGIIAAVTREIEFKRLASVFSLTALGGCLIFLFLGLGESFLILTQTSALLFLLMFALHQKWTGVHAILAGFIVLSLIFFLMVGAGTDGDLLSAYAKIKDQVSQTLESNAMFYKDAVTQTDAIELEVWLKELRGFILFFLPGLMGIIFIFMSFFNVLMTKRFVRQADDVFPPAFSLWKLPYNLIWLAILAGALSLFANGTLNLLGCNSLLILASLYFIQGCSIILFYFNEYQVPRFVRIIIYILISLHWYGLLMVALTGLADVWFQLRAKADPVESNPS